MSRQDEVLQALQTMAARATESGPGALQGFTAEEVANVVGIWRSNCSADLNALAKTHVIRKIPGRPARFMPFSASAMTIRDGTAPEEPAVGLYRRPESMDPKGIFKNGQQSNELYNLNTTVHSLNDAVERAKAALCYPPHGMNILLLGETGVGKSVFARQMYQYCLDTHLLTADAPFIEFNCAEYAHNSQMLLDHLFGHVRGAFTGAAEDKVGLVEAANRGVLFLDEVHRLPPEGQEMLFELLDQGAFRRVGESSRTRAVTVRVFAATTETPESALLATFRRRIPMIISLPALRDWYLEDRIALIRFFFLREARTLCSTIRLTRSAYVRLLDTQFSANIGGLENAIKLSCARVFANRSPVRTSNSRKNGLELLIRPEDLVLSGANTSALHSVEPFPNEDDIVFSSDAFDLHPSLVLLAESGYGKLDQLAQTLFDLGLDSDDLGYVLERHIRRRTVQEPGRSILHELRRFVGDSFYTAVRHAWTTIEQELAANHPEAIFALVAMHLFGVIRHSSNRLQEDNLMADVVCDDFTLQLSERFLHSLSQTYYLEYSEQEIRGVAAMLQRNEESPTQGMGVVLLLRGTGVADALANTATGIFGDMSVRPCEIPLDYDPTMVLHQLLESIHSLHANQRILVFTDIDEVRQYVVEHRGIIEGSRVKIVFRPDVTRVIETALLLRTPGGFDEIAEVQPGARAILQHLEVVACCLTGRGTASAIRRFIELSLPADLQQTVTVRTMEMSLSGKPKIISDKQADNDCLTVAVVGSIDPHLPDVPFFSLEEILKPDGVRQLIGLIRYAGSLNLPEVTPTPTASAHSSNPTDQVDGFQSYVLDMLERDLVYVNPRLVHTAAMEMLERVNAAAHRPNSSFSRELRARFALHMGYVVERGILRHPLKNPSTPLLRQRYPSVWRRLVEAWQPIEDAFRLAPDEDELAYLFELLFPDLTAEVMEYGSDITVSPRR